MFFLHYNEGTLNSNVNVNYMITQERREELEQWVGNALFKRFNAIRFYDPWDLYDGDWNGSSDGFAYSDVRYVSQYISREALDSLIEEIFATFDDFSDLDYIRTSVVNRCRYIMTCVEKFCFASNLHKIIEWAVKNSQIKRQLRGHFGEKFLLPPEMVDEVFSYALPLPKPQVQHIHDFERNLYSKYIERPDLRFYKSSDDFD